MIWRALDRGPVTVGGMALSLGRDTLRSSLGQQERDSWGIALSLGRDTLRSSLGPQGGESWGIALSETHYDLQQDRRPVIVLGG